MKSLKKQAGFVGSIIGSLIDNRSRRSEVKRQNESNERINTQNIAFQREANQNALQWRVEDAKKAGIHPLAGIGSNFTATAPVVVPSEGLPSRLAGMGQSIGRAIDSASNKPVELPGGPIVYPDGSSHPHYTDPKTGKAIPYSYEQLQFKNALEHHDAQMSVMSAQARALTAEAQSYSQPVQTPSMFTYLNHPRLGKIPFPNPDLGESAEALSYRRIAGLWLDEVRQTPGLYERLNSIVVKEFGQSLGSLAEESPDLLQDLIRGLISGSTQQ